MRLAASFSKPFFPLYSAEQAWNARVGYGGCGSSSSSLSSLSYKHIHNVVP